MTISIEKIESQDYWNTMVLKSKYTSPTHFFSEADFHYKITINNEVYLLPIKQFSLYGAKVALSYGTRVDGGIVPLNGYNYLEDCLTQVKDFLRLEGYDLLNLTFKLYYMKDYTNTIAEYLDRIANFSITIYARILPLSKGFEYIWKNKFNKKARNLVRKFLRSGGKVELLKNPLNYVDDIMEINLSKPLRQGRPLPETYTRKDLVIQILERNIRDKGEHFRVYGAFIKDKLVAYAYVSEHNGYAYISRFLTHAKYFKYAASNGLLSFIIESLCKEGVKVVQYGYWSRHYEGVNHFLQQHGFEKGEVRAYYIPLTMKGSLVLKMFKTLYKIKESFIGDFFRKYSSIRMLYHKVVPRI